MLMRVTRAVAPSSFSRRHALRSSISRAAPSQPTVPVTDDAVPEGHHGLHGFLYESESESEHAAAVYRVRQKEDDGTSLIPAGVWTDARNRESPLGVFAVYDSAETCQYVGYSRNVVNSVRSLERRFGSDRVAFVRAMVFANRTMATRQNMERERQRWLTELPEGFVPPGNSDEASEWEPGAERGIDESAMSDAERALYEDKKLKLRKAMGESLVGEDDEHETLDQRERRLRTIIAVEGDDWSAVVGQQTSETTTAAESTDQAQAQEQQGQQQQDGTTIQSPFERAAGKAAAAGGNKAAEGLATPQPLNAETVDAALEEVRPYLIADGGNVEVVDVEDGIVRLRLQGACGTCPSSTATMKSGIETTLRRIFGEAVREVVQVDSQFAPATVEAVDEHLDLLRNAITNYGGSVEVTSVQGNTCELKFEGPQPLAMGIAAAVRDKFPDLTDVRILTDGK
mmetsp:Transcript_24265/g.79140  ORF Transcript_24265/g.79140 Transcript_24265/m.79140 type:complete len:456 (-) Transcript_24265:2156-3523(-)